MAGEKQEGGNCTGFIIGNQLNFALNRKLEERSAAKIERGFGDYYCQFFISLIKMV
jgi:hypothetical protein